MYSSSYSASSVSDSLVWLIISIVLAIVGGFVLYFLFLNKKNEGRYQGFLGWAYEFLNFKKFTVEAILKVTYLIFAIYITLASFAYIGDSFISFLLMLFVGNLVLRLVYELMLVTLMICRNTTEINQKLSLKEKTEETKQEDK